MLQVDSTFYYAGEIVELKKSKPKLLFSKEILDSSEKWPIEFNITIDNNSSKEYEYKLYPIDSNEGKTINENPDAGQFKRGRN